MHKKYIKIILFVFIVVLIAIIFQGGKKKHEIAQADSNQNLSGFAWSSNFGWISFNKSDCDKASFVTCRDKTNKWCVAGDVSKIGISCNVNGDCGSGGDCRPTHIALDYSCTGSPNACTVNGGECVNWCNICNNRNTLLCDNNSDCMGG